MQGVVGGSFDFMVARFTTGGVLDGGFGNGGVASTPIGTQNDFAGHEATERPGKRQHLSDADIEEVWRFCDGR